MTEDTLSFVSQHMNRFETRLGAELERIVIPNGIESLALNVERKDPLRNWHDGHHASIKRSPPHLVMLELLSKASPSVILKIKGKLPKEYPWMKRRVEENGWYDDQFNSYRDLFENNNIVHEGFTPDVSHFVATSTSVLSVSDHESFHIAPLEGAVGRTLVHMLPWEGAGEVHRPNWIFDSVEEMANDLLRFESKGTAYELGCDNRQFVMNHYDHRYIAMELYRQAAKNCGSTRSTVAPKLMTTHPQSNLYPRKVPPAPLMKVRSLVQQDNELPLMAENLIRVQELRHRDHVRPSCCQF